MKKRNKTQKPDYIQLIMASDPSDWVDIGTHYLINVVNQKYCVSELIIAGILSKLPNSESKGKGKSGGKGKGKPPSLSDLLKELRSTLKKQHPNISIRDLTNLSNTLIEERHALVHGTMVFGKKISIPSPSTWVSPFDTNKITMKNGGLEIPLTQERIRDINNRWNKFRDLVIELVIDLDLDGLSIQVDDTEPEYLLLRDLLRLNPIDTNISRHCRVCKRDFIDDDACIHLKVQREALNEKKTLTR